MRVILLVVLILLTLGGGGAWLWWDRNQTPPLRVGTNVWPGYESLYLARELGFFEHRPIELLELRSASDVMQLFRSGSIEAAALTLDETLSILQDGFDLGVVAVMDLSRGGDVLLARPGITTLAQLRGRRIGVESSAVGAVLLDAALTAAQLNDDQVEIVPLSVDEHEWAYSQGRIDAVVTFEPVATRLQERGARRLFDSRQIPGRIVDVLVVRRDLLAGREKALTALVRGHFRALAYLNAQPGEAAPILSKRLGLAPEEVMQVYRGLHLPTLAENHRWLSGPEPLLQVTGKQMAEFMWQRRLLRRPVQLDRLAEPQFLPRVLQ